MLISTPNDWSDKLSKAPICGVFATAVGGNTSINNAWNYYAATRRPNWKGALPARDICEGITHFGGKIIRTPELSDKFRGRMMKDFSHYISMVDPTSIYLVFSTRHVQIAQGRNIIDQGGLKDFTEFRWSRKFIREPIAKLIIPNVVKVIENQEIDINMTKKTSKFSRAQVIVPSMLSSGSTRKEILAQLVTELETTWGSASTFYHRVTRETNIQEKENG